MSSQRPPEAVATPRRGGASRGASRAKLAALAMLALGFGPCPEGSETPRSAPSGEVDPGRALYVAYCQGCHGSQGRGDGPVASSLRVPPPDLSRLWEKYGTPLDRDRLVAYIDGRSLLGLHGDSEMPVWGDEFFGDTPPLAPNVEGLKRHLIELLADHLERLQSKQQL